jgi:hypothetical protein
VVDRFAASPGWALGEAAALQGGSEARCRTDETRRRDKRGDDVVPAVRALLVVPVHVHLLPVEGSREHPRRKDWSSMAEGYDE